ncbi:Lcl C-terminal domain-containing protein [Candidatus Electrothrix sp.]|uniref:Lcl C-terminal domain-containing protein n=1 Tax=Candidatus Electrothrix sp. TaxID=2170559 RepID=UPI004056B2F9
MRTYFFILCCIFSAATVHAAQTCRTDSIPASTPNSQLIDNGNGTVTDLKTGLMWKQCLEGVSGNTCEDGSPSEFTWQEALQQPGTVNAAGGFAGYTDWRLPNIRELDTLVEEQCYNPAINLNRFPNTPSSDVWSGSPYAGSSVHAWGVCFGHGDSDIDNRNDVYGAVRLVRGGQ